MRKKSRQRKTTPRSRARDDDRLMNLGFSGGKACGGFPSCLLTGAERKPGQECEAPPTGGLLLMRVLSCAIHRLGDGKSVPSERVASSRMELFMGAWGQRPQQATWDLSASENPRFGLGGSHEALLAGFSYPVFMPFRAVFLQMRKEDAYTSSFSSSASFNLMAPSMTPSTMGRYFSGQSCNLWLVRWRCSLSSRSSSGLK